MRSTVLRTPRNRVTHTRSMGHSQLNNYFNISLAKVFSFSINLSPSLTSTDAACWLIPNRSAISKQLPPARFAAFYAELIAKRCWSREDAVQLARHHGHMLSGAMESINEWAFDEFGAQLVYDGEDDVELELDLLEGSG